MRQIWVGQEGITRVLLGFTGEYQQKVDGKGRMSIPADFRRALEAGDPSAREGGGQPGIYVLYGPHLSGKLVAHSVDSFTQMGEAIMSIRPRNAEEAKRKRMAQVSILGNAVRLEMDKDGRVVLPQRQREKIGLTEGEVVYLGLGDCFEIWPATTYEAEVGAVMADEIAALGSDYDPMADVWDLVPV